MTPREGMPSDQDSDHCTKKTKTTHAARSIGVGTICGD